MVYGSNGRSALVCGHGSTIPLCDGALPLLKADPQVRCAPCRYEHMKYDQNEFLKTMHHLIWFREYEHGM